MNETLETSKNLCFDSYLKHYERNIISYVLLGVVNISLAITNSYGLLSKYPFILFVLQALGAVGHFFKSSSKVDELLKENKETKRKHSIIEVDNKRFQIEINELRRETHRGNSDGSGDPSPLARFGTSWVPMQNNNPLEKKGKSEFELSVNRHIESGDVSFNISMENSKISRASHMREVTFEPEVKPDVEINIDSPDD